MTSSEFHLDPESVQRLSDALEQLWNTLKEIAETLAEWREENIKPLFEEFEWTLSAKKPNTPYAKPIWFGLFDKRQTIYCFRRDRR